MFCIGKPNFHFLVNKTEKNNIGEEAIALKESLDEKNDIIKKTDILINNFNAIQSTIYFGSAKPVNGGPEKNFTAFTIFYNKKFYLITAGHCIEYEGIKYTDFRFMANNSHIEIVPELLDFDNDYENNIDFAIFYSRLVGTGLYTDIQNNNPLYIFGNTERKLNFLRKFNIEKAKEGESGSPVLNSECKVVGLVINNNNSYTPIAKILTAIDNLKTNADS